MSTIYTLNGKVLKNSANDKWLIKKETPVDPYNPLGLPPFTIRCKFKSGYTPSMGDSQTLVDAGENVWDIYKNSTDWSSLFVWNSNLLVVLGANTTGVTNMSEMFSNSTTITSIPLFDTRNVSTTNRMFYRCSITSIPLFDTSSITNIAEMFSGCTNVQSGALALYQQAYTQTNPPNIHHRCFRNCGANTVTGASELAQIPDDWK